MFRKPNEVLPSRKFLTPADFSRHWKLGLLQLFWFILIIALFVYTLHLFLDETKYYLTKDLRLLGQVLRLEMKEKMGSGNTEQRSGADDKEIKEEKAREIGEISEGLLEKLSPFYFICVAYRGEVLATATNPRASGGRLSADYLCDRDTIRNHAVLPDGQEMNYYYVSARKLGDKDIPPTLHSLNDEDGNGFHLWVVKELQQKQLVPTYYFVKDNLLPAVLILGAIGLPAYAWGRFVRRESRSKSDSGGEGIV